MYASNTKKKKKKEKKTTKKMQKENKLRCKCSVRTHERAE